WKPMTTNVETIDCVVYRPCCSRLLALTAAVSRFVGKATRSGYRLPGGLCGLGGSAVRARSCSPRCRMPRTIAGRAGRVGGRAPRDVRLVLPGVTVRHPHALLLPHWIGVCLGEIGDVADGRGHPQRGQGREYARRVLRRGAVVEGPRDGPLQRRRRARAERHR